MKEYCGFATLFISWCGGWHHVGFTYIKSIQVAPNIKIPPNGPGCNCKEKCTNPMTCSCARLNNHDFPYVSQDGGRLDLIINFAAHER